MPEPVELTIYGDDHQVTVDRTGSSALLAEIPLEQIQAVVRLLAEYQGKPIKIRIEESKEF